MFDLILLAFNFTIMQIFWDRPIWPKPDDWINRINRKLDHRIYLPSIFLVRVKAVNLSKLTRSKLDWILGSKQYFRSYGFFSPTVIFIYLFGYLVFYLYGPLDLVYWTSLDILRLKNFWRLFWSFYFLFPKDRGFLFPSQNVQFLCIIKRLTRKC